ncbi:unnamed protein product [Staurois parvus]|uniref:Ribosomal protein eL8/eL30/eS12/Gadd45 domain-containing protein n=1 Tax=Staurois parvus TaxID=386267 RepID=A0ABN9AVV7_9NEOB|nr:unnamed protein product [Staurois parvus]
MPVVGENMQFILKTLTEMFTQVGLKKVEIHKKFIKKGKRSKKENPNGADKIPDLEGEKFDGENAKDETVKSGWTLSDIRKHLAIGINEVTRALEKNEVHLVIVCKSAKPQMIIQHVPELSASRGVTACLLPRLSENVAPVLGLKSVLALGFKKTSDIFFRGSASYRPTGATP